MAPVFGQVYQEPPFHYSRTAEITVVFRTDLEILKQIFPPPLKPLSRRGLATVRLTCHAESPFGPYTAIYLGAPALMGDEPVFYFLSGMKTTFSGVVAGREIWGMPLQVGDVSADWEGDQMRIKAGRNGTDFVQMTLRLVKRKEPKDAKRLGLSVFATKRQLFEKEAPENILVGLRGKSDTTGFDFWDAQAVLHLVGGEPGDEWSALPVHEIVSAEYSTGARSILERGNIVAEW